MTALYLDMIFNSNSVFSNTFSPHAFYKPSMGYTYPHITEHCTYLYKHKPSQRYRHKHMLAQMWRNTDIGTCSSVRYVTKVLLPFCCQFSTPILYTSGLTNTFPSSTFLYFSPPTFRTVIQMTVNNGELSWWIVHHFTDFQPIVVSGFLFPSVMTNHIFFSFLFFSFFFFFFFYIYCPLNFFLPFLF